MSFTRLGSLFAGLLLFTFASHAQRAEKFDVFSYTPPAGWEEKKTDAGRQFITTDDKGGFCIITLSSSIVSQGTSKADFDVIWKTLVVEQLRPAVSPQMGASGAKQGWMAEVGVAPFESDGLKEAAMLTTMTGNGRAIGVLAVTNSDTYSKDIEAFVDSIVLPPIANDKKQSAVTEPAGDNSRLIGKWNRSGSVHPTYADPVSWGTAGYTKSRYEFRADGTYIFTERSFRMMMQNIIVVKEAGKYSVSGNSITLSPAKSTIASYKKAGGVDALGALVRSQNRELESASYKFTFHYFEGIQEWNLVLQADRQTQRDGQFSGNTTYQNAWYFDQKYTDNDLTAIKP